MRIKLGNIWHTVMPGYPIMVELTDQDKKNIANMSPEATKYAVFDDNGMFPWPTEDKLKWMEE